MKKLITLSTLLLCGITLAACNTNTGKKDVTAETTTIVQETTSQETAEATTTVPTKDTQWIGSDGYGYLKVPKSWVRSNFGEKSVDFKYNDGTDKNAISVKSINADVKNFTNFETKFVQNIKENPRFTNVRTNSEKLFEIKKNADKSTFSNCIFFMKILTFVCLATKRLPINLNYF